MIWKAKDRIFEGTGVIMGVLNVTPDSFSDGGTHNGYEDALAFAEEMLAQGADIIDVGGESTRPGSAAPSIQEELDRVLPVVCELVARGVCVSVDTRHWEVAQACVKAGVHIINDVSGFRDPKMREVAAVFGKQYLRDVGEAAFYENLPAVRRAAGDRAALRAMHFFDDDRRVTQQADALLRGDFDEFLRLVKESGRSSWLYLQDVVPLGATRGQHMALALALAEKLLGGRGACRVHGGGFAGTIQAFVPLDALEHFRCGMEAVLGAGSCHILSVRPEGGVLLEEYA